MENQSLSKNVTHKFLTVEKNFNVCLHNFYLYFLLCLCEIKKKNKNWNTKSVKSFYYTCFYTFILGRTYSR